MEPHVDRCWYWYWFIHVRVIYSRHHRGPWDIEEVNDICTVYSYKNIQSSYTVKIRKRIHEFDKRLNVTIYIVLVICVLKYSKIQYTIRPAPWSSGQRFWLLIMRSQVRFPALLWGFFPDRRWSPWWPWSRQLVEFRFKAPPGTPYSYITIHLFRTA
jgi:hypothetical protein